MSRCTSNPGAQTLLFCLAVVHQIPQPPVYCGTLRLYNPLFSNLELAIPLLATLLFEIRRCRRPQSAPKSCGRSPFTGGPPYPLRSDTVSCSCSHQQYEIVQYIQRFEPSFSRIFFPRRGVVSFCWQQLSSRLSGRRVTVYEGLNTLTPRVCNLP